MNSKLITNLVIPLSNNAFTNIPSSSSSYFNSIFTVTSLNNFSSFSTLLLLFSTSIIVIYKSTCPENYIPTVMPPLNPTSPPSMAATFLATRLMAVLQPSRYSVFHDGDTSIQLSLPWRSYFCQCLNTETSAWGNRGCYHWNPEHLLYYQFVYKTSSYTVIR